MELLIQIAQILGPAIIATVFILMIKADVKILSVRMDGIIDNLKVLNGSFGKLSDILTSVAVQDQRISGIEEDMRELKHGRGFVDITGEYTSKVSKAGKSQSVPPMQLRIPRDRLNQSLVLSKAPLIWAFLQCRADWQVWCSTQSASADEFRSWPFFGASALQCMANRHYRLLFLSIPPQSEQLHLLRPLQIIYLVQYVNCFVYIVLIINAFWPFIRQIHNWQSTFTIRHFIP